jgi:hypothetical protein
VYLLLNSHKVQPEIGLTVSALLLMLFEYGWNDKLIRTVQEQLGTIKIAQ